MKQDINTGSNNLEVKENGIKQKSVFSLENFPADHIILTFQGDKVHGSEIKDYTHFLEIEDNWFLSPSGKEDDFVNHSCEPNCAIVMQGNIPCLVSIRPIEAGDEITYDYSTMMLKDQTSFTCACGSKNCRGLIGPATTLPDSLIKQYKSSGLLPEFIATATESAGTSN